MNLQTIFSPPNRPEIRELLHLAWPVVTQQIGHILFAFFDTVMIGPLGPAYLAAASIANGIFFLLMVFVLGMTYVLSPLTSEFLGARQPARTPFILVSGLYITPPTILIFGGLAWLSAEFLYLFQLPADVTPLASSYLKILALSSVPLMFFQIFRQYIDGLGFTRPAMIITWLGLALNVLVNYLLIYGHLGFPALALDGCGWATVISRIAMAAALALVLWMLPTLRTFTPSKHHWSVHWESIRKILSIGLPSGSQYFFEAGAFTFSAILIGWMGTVELASHQVAINLASMTYMVATGFSAAGSIRVGFWVGRKNADMQRLAGFQVIILTGAVMGSFGLIFVLLHPWLPLLYTSDLAVIQIASYLLIIAALFQISDGVQAVGLGILRGLKDTRIPTGITIIAYWVIGIPLGALAGFYLDWGVYGLWAGLSVGLTVSAALLTWRFVRLTGKRL